MQFDTRFMRIILCWMCWGVCAVVGSVQAQPVILRTAAQEGSAPKFIDGDGPARGLCPDILHALEKTDQTLHFAIDPIPTPIKRLEISLRDGSLDVICALLETPLRNEIAHRIPVPLFNLQERLVGRRDDLVPIRNWDDLARVGGPVVTVAGASYAGVLRAHGVVVEETTGGSAIALRNVDNQRMRFYYTNELTGAYYIKSAGLGARLRLHPGALQTSPSYLWVRRGIDASTLRRVERAVDQLQRKGVLERIYRQYQEVS